MLYAHSAEGKDISEWQTLETHLNAVGELAGAFAAAFNAGPWGKLAGSLHDLGKGSEAFQKRLQGRGPKVDHASAGARQLLETWGRKIDGAPNPQGAALARLPAYCIIGHHGGLPDCGGTAADTGTLLARLSPANALPDYTEAVPLVSIPPFTALGQLPLSGKTPKDLCFTLHFFIRMLYSCLTDADFLDTEAFCSPENAALRPIPPKIEQLAETLEQALRRKGYLQALPPSIEMFNRGADAPCGTPERQEGINAARCGILHACRQAAVSRPGVFSLTVPTGGGKTLSSLAFALEHARRHNLRRIILVEPYTSIIEQNAQVFRDMLGEEAVLEHHCQFIHPDMDNAEEAETDAARQYRLSTENWDATVIVTTSVQFFESLFAAHASRCRKLHNIAQSVIVLDEAQMLPTPLLEPSVLALGTLVKHYGATVLLCTATQPALNAGAPLPFGFDAVREIIPEGWLPILFRLFDRASVHHLGVMSDAELAEALLRENQVLCIVNSRNRARDLFSLLGTDESHFHLSARMTPVHRSAVLKTIRRRLEEGKPCRIVSTSLIECGVDISLPVVFREENGLDTIAQSAGRCNRHGERTEGRVFIFQAEKGLPRRAAELQRRVAMFARVKNEPDLFAPDTVRRYFSDLYQAGITDEKEVVRKITLHKTNEASFPFREIEEAYRFIDEATVPIIIENEASRPFIEKLEGFAPLQPATLRTLQRHSVTVYDYERKRLEQDGRIERLRDRFFVLRGELGYSEQTGLLVDMEGGFKAEDLLF